MKAVLISIQPKWCELIASGKKTVEVRKSAPNLETPFKCYIYCTQGKTANGKNLYVNPPDKRREYGVVEDWEIKNDKIDIGNGYGEYTAIGASGKVIGEFVCDCIDKLTPDYNSIRKQYFYNNDWENHDWNSDDYCLTDTELLAYGKGKTLYGWHISELKIYDKPKELSEFNQRKKFHWYDYCGKDKPVYEYVTITRPPQSWCYVEEI